MIDIQEYSVPEKISEARKWKIVRLAQAAVASAIQRRLAATSDEQSHLLPLLVLRLSLNAETSQVNIQILW